jgi:L-cysteate sulfo-lyase
MIQLGSFPRYALCDLPTPLERAHRLEQVLGSDSPRIWIKRDDLTGLAFGGNKARKLEYLLGDAIARGADHLITEGALQVESCAFDGCGGSQGRDRLYAGPRPATGQRR